MKRYISNSRKETQEVAKQFAQDFKGKGGIIGLSGELGAGKTTFVQGFAKGLGIKEKIISPTFVLVRQHKIPKSNRFLFHIDLYRLEEKVDPKILGIKDMLDNPKNIILIEWAEKLKKDLTNALKIELSKTSETVREISLL